MTLFNKTIYLQLKKVPVGYTYLNKTNLVTT